MARIRDLTAFALNLEAKAIRKPLKAAQYQQKLEAKIQAALQKGFSVEISGLQIAAVDQYQIGKVSGSSGQHNSATTPILPEKPKEAVSAGGAGGGGGGSGGGGGFVAPPSSGEKSSGDTNSSSSTGTGSVSGSDSGGKTNNSTGSSSTTDKIASGDLTSGDLSQDQYRGATVQPPGVTETDPNGKNIIYGLPDDETIASGPSNDWVNGGGGGDRLDGGTGKDWVSFHRFEYNDAIFNPYSSGVNVDLLNAAYQYDSFGVGYSGNATNFENIYGSEGDDVLKGDDTSNEMRGGEGWDYIVGQAGADYLYGGGGDDTLVGGAWEPGAPVLDPAEMRGVGNDNNVLMGGDGDDLLVSGIGNDWIDGGDGDNDIVDYSYLPDFFTVRLTLIPNGVWAKATVYTLGPSGDEIVYEQDWVRNVEGIKGGLAADDITGDPTKPNNLDAGPGKDTVNGGGLNDTLDGGQDDDSVDGGLGDDLLLGGGGGNDTFKGGGGIDTLSFERIPGKPYDPCAGLQYDTRSLVIDLSSEDYSWKQSPEAALWYGQLSEIENLVGSRCSDQIAGDFTDNLLNGGAGNDLIFGAGGSDTFIGGSGNDWIVFKNVTAGNTPFQRYNAGGQSPQAAAFTISALDDVQTSALASAQSNDPYEGGIEADLSTGWGWYVTDGGVTRFELSGFENLMGSRGSDKLTGDAGAHIVLAGVVPLISSGDSLKFTYQGRVHDLTITFEIGDSAVAAVQRALDEAAEGALIADSTNGKDLRIRVAESVGISEVQKIEISLESDPTEETIYSLKYGGTTLDVYAEGVETIEALAQEFRNSTGYANAPFTIQARSEDVGYLVLTWKARAAVEGLATFEVDDVKLSEAVVVSKGLPPLEENTLSHGEFTDSSSLIKAREIVDGDSYYLAFDRQVQNLSDGDRISFKIPDATPVDYTVSIGAQIADETQDGGLGIAEVQKIEISLQSDPPAGTYSLKVGATTLEVGAEDITSLEDLAEGFRSSTAYLGAPFTIQAASDGSNNLILAWKERAAVESLAAFALDDEELFVAEATSEGTDPISEVQKLLISPQAGKFYVLVAGDTFLSSSALNAASLDELVDQFTNHFNYESAPFEITAGTVDDAGKLLITWKNPGDVKDSASLLSLAGVLPTDVSADIVNGTDLWFKSDLPLSDGFLSNTVFSDDTAAAVDNVLLGDGGQDTILGGLGADTMYGGAGQNIVSGGLGADKFYVGYHYDPVQASLTDDDLSRANTVQEVTLRGKADELQFGYKIQFVFGGQTYTATLERSDASALTPSESDIQAAIDEALEAGKVQARLIGDDLVLLNTTSDAAVTNAKVLARDTIAFHGLNNIMLATGNLRDGDRIKFKYDGVDYAIWLYRAGIGGNNQQLADAINESIDFAPFDDQPNQSEIDKYTHLIDKVEAYALGDSIYLRSTDGKTIENGSIVNKDGNLISSSYNPNSVIASGIEAPKVWSFGFSEDYIQDWEDGADSLYVAPEAVAIISGYLSAGAPSDDWDETSNTITLKGSNVDNFGRIIVSTGAGDDLIYGSNGDDWIYAGKGSDDIDLGASAEDGADRVYIDSPFARYEVTGFDAKDTIYIDKNIVDAMGRAYTQQTLLSAVQRFDPTIDPTYYRDDRGSGSVFIDEGQGRESGTLTGPLFNFVYDKVIGGLGTSNGGSHNYEHLLSQIAAQGASSAAAAVILGVGIGVSYIPIVGPIISIPFFVTSGIMFYEIAAVNQQHRNPVYNGPTEWIDDALPYLTYMKSQQAMAGGEGRQNYQFLDFYDASFGDGFTPTLEMESFTGSGLLSLPSVRVLSGQDGVYSIIALEAGRGSASTGDDETFIYLVFSPDSLIQNNEAFLLAEVNGFLNADQIKFYDSLVDSEHTQYGPGAGPLPVIPPAPVLLLKGLTDDPATSGVDESKATVATIAPGGTATFIASLASAPSENVTVVLQVFESGSPGSWQTVTGGSWSVSAGASFLQEIDVIPPAGITQADYRLVVSGSEPAFNRTATFKIAVDNKAPEITSVAVSESGIVVSTDEAGTAGLYTSSGTTAAISVSSDRSAIFDFIEQTSGVLILTKLRVADPAGNYLNANAGDEFGTEGDGVTVLPKIILGTGAGSSGTPEALGVSIETTPVAIYGFGGVDSIVGGSGNDYLYGGLGNDTITGGNGDDLLHGGRGADSMTGGDGEDRFVWSENNQFGEGDVISDFVSNEDLIQISAAALGASYTRTVNVKDDNNQNILDGDGNPITTVEAIQITGDQFELAVAATSLNTRFFFDAVTGKLYFDADGNGLVSSAQLIVTLTGSTPLTMLYTDILLV